MSTFLHIGHFFSNFVVSWKRENKISNWIFDTHIPFLVRTHNFFHRNHWTTLYPMPIRAKMAIIEITPLAINILFRWKSDLVAQTKFKNYDFNFEIVFWMTHTLVYLLGPPLQNWAWPLLCQKILCCKQCPFFKVEEVIALAKEPLFSTHIRQHVHIF